MAAATAVSLLSVATSLMASATASAQVITVATPAPVAMNATNAAGSPAGLVLGLLAVIGVAAVSFIVRVGTGRSTHPHRVITIPELTVARQFVPAYAD